MPGTKLVGSGGAGKICGTKLVGELGGGGGERERARGRNHMREIKREGCGWREGAWAVNGERCNGEKATGRERESERDG